MKIDWWNYTLRQRHQAEALPNVKDPLSSCHQAGGGYLRDRVGIKTGPCSMRR